jgi:hypothetical protein
MGEKPSPYKRGRKAVKASICSRVGNCEFFKGPLYMLFVSLYP